MQVVGQALQSRRLPGIQRPVALRVVAHKDLAEGRPEGFDMAGEILAVFDEMKCDLEVDGGMDPETARLCVEAGAGVLVAGTSGFGTNKSGREAINRLRAGGE